jgi:Na+/H+ antiporter NhaD/arsenite permease-like protein
VIPPVVIAGAPAIPAWLIAPFAVLLASIALMPFISARVWHRFYAEFSLLLGAITAGYYLGGYTTPAPGEHLPYGQEHILHALLEYYSFIALVGGLYIVSGTILVDLRGRGGPFLNSLLLAFGSVAANIVGTTGASMLLVRPYMRINRGRLRPLHLVFFIFIISNTAGSLTPIGDPPLYLGYLKGVPFFWTLRHLIGDWAFTVGALLAVFLVYDMRVGPARTQVGPPLAVQPEAEMLIEEEIRVTRPRLRISGASGLLCLALMIGGVFLDPVIKRLSGFEGLPIGATFQIAVAALAYALAPRIILRENDFTFGPVKEVGLLFLGIFVTMTPALAYLAEHGRSLGIDTPTAFYFATGALSAVLDNAPTYVNFLQVAIGEEMTPGAIRAFLSTRQGPVTLAAISTGAVFFGAMTYIGNGPNFMVKAIAESAALRMPSFLGFAGYAMILLLPVLVLHWFAFVYLS